VSASWPGSPGFQNSPDPYDQPSWWYWAQVGQLVNFESARFVPLTPPRTDIEHFWTMPTYAQICWNGYCDCIWLPESICNRVVRLSRNKALKNCVANAINRWCTEMCAAEPKAARVKRIRYPISHPFILQPARADPCVIKGSKPHQPSLAYRR
jgi:hypothetical protein